MGDRNDRRRRTLRRTLTRGLASLTLAVTLGGAAVVGGAQTPSLQAANAALRDSPSPYLRAHASDAVAWRTFAAEAFAEARQTGRLVWISSGYYACYWCHVLQRETLIDTAFAAAIEPYFVPVLIDRELEPAVDAFLLEFLRATRGFAGWPLNVVVTADGDPLTGLVYEPREAFERYLTEVGRRHARDPEAVRALARSAREELRERARAEQRRASPRLDAPPERRFERAVAVWLDAWAGQADDFEGGLGTTAKYPRTPVLDAALTLLALPEGVHAGRDAQRAALADWVETTLDAMAGDGLRDPVDGGFYRYSETPDWATPHFETMLGDQTRLAEVYARAARVLGAERFAQVAALTFAMIPEQFALSAAGVDGPRRLSSGLSAIDRRGVEGGDRLVAPERLESLLEASVDAALGPADDAVRDALATALRVALGVHSAPAFDAGFLLTDRQGFGWRADPDLDAPLARAWQAFVETLRERRAATPRPRDDKALLGAHAGWIALWARHVDARRADATDWARDARLAAELLALADAALERDRPPPALLDGIAGDREAPEADLAASVELARALAALAARAGDDAGFAARLAPFVAAESAAATGEADGDGADQVSIEARLAARLVRYLAAVHRWFATDEGWRTTRELPLPAMTAAPFLPGVHERSPSAVWLALAEAGLDDAEALALLDDDTVADARERVERVRAWRPAVAIERDPLAHSDTIAGWVRAWLE